MVQSAPEGDVVGSGGVAPSPAGKLLRYQAKARHLIEAEVALGGSSACRARTSVPAMARGLRKIARSALPELQAIQSPATQTDRSHRSHVG
jgi:hypothetical protein